MNLRQGSLPSLGHPDSVIYISHSLIQTVDLPAHDLRDSKSSRIVTGPINSVPAGQLLQGFTQIAVRDPSVSVGDCR